MAAEAAAHDHHLDVVGQRFAGEARGHIGVVEIAGEIAGHLEKLRVSVGPQALVALLAVLRLEGLGIEVELFVRAIERIGHEGPSGSLDASSWR